MASIASAVIAWLKTYPLMPAGVDISTDILPVEGDDSGLFKTPGDSVVHNVDGSREVTSTFLLRIQKPMQDETLRAEAREWMEKFERWSRDQNVLGNLPTLDEDRTCESCRFTESAWVFYQDPAETVYQIGVEIVFDEPRTTIEQEDNVE